MQGSTLLSTATFDLTHDEIHQYAAQDQSAVSHPLHSFPFQLAAEAPPHIWPHNAAQVGMQQYLGSIEPPPNNEDCLGYELSTSKWQWVYFAFFYTHPRLSCAACQEKGWTCLQVYWDGPDDKGSWPNPISGSVIAHKCWGCRVMRVECSCFGLPLVEGSPTLRMPLNQALQGKLKQQERSWRMRRNMRTAFPYSTLGPTLPGRTRSTRPPSLKPQASGHSVISEGSLSSRPRVKRSRAKTAVSATVKQRSTGSGVREAPLGVIAGMIGQYEAAVRHNVELMKENEGLRNGTQPGRLVERQGRRSSASQLSDGVPLLAFDDDDNETPSSSTAFFTPSSTEAIPHDPSGKTSTFPSIHHRSVWQDQHIPLQPLHPTAPHYMSESNPSPLHPSSDVQPPPPHYVQARIDDLEAEKSVLLNRNVSLANSVMMLKLRLKQIREE